MDTPRGLEVLLKKASVDTEFRTLLLENRSGACAAIGLELDPAESAMLDAMPAEQLEAIIRRTHVRPEDRRVFLGKAASVMLAALVGGVSGCKEKEKPEKQRDGTYRVTRGHAADNPGRARPVPPPSPNARPEQDAGTGSTA